MTTNELYAQMGLSQKVLDFGAQILESCCIFPRPPMTGSAATILTAIIPFAR